MASDDGKGTGGQVDAVDASIEAGSAVAGAIVGFAVGGPLGAIAGAATPTLVARGARAMAGVLERRRQRAQGVVLEAFARSTLATPEIVERLEESEELADHIMRLIELASRADPEIGSLLSALMAESFDVSTGPEMERLAIVATALEGLRPIHIKVLRAIRDAGGSLGSQDIATIVGVPVVELRGTVRELELRGMIKDLGEHPVIWRLRELGLAVLSFLK